MPKYVDGFVLVVPKKKVDAYKKMARKAGKIWREHGALEYRECIADDMSKEMCMPMTQMAKSKPTDTVFFSYIVYKSRAHRDQVNKKVMKDPRIQNMCDEKDMPFDPKKMAYGGFKTAVEA